VSAGRETAERRGKSVCKNEGVGYGFSMDIHPVETRAFLKIKAPGCPGTEERR
jgi:hypothetical protein